MFSFALAYCTYRLPNAAVDNVMQVLDEFSSCPLVVERVCIVLFGLFLGQPEASSHFTAAGGLPAVLRAANDHCDRPGTSTC